MTVRMRRDGLNEIERYYLTGWMGWRGQSMKAADQVGGQREGGKMLRMGMRSSFEQFLGRRDGVIIPRKDGTESSCYDAI